jgi:hypothetical protein
VLVLGMGSGEISILPFDPTTLEDEGNTLVQRIGEH